MADDFDSVVLLDMLNAYFIRKPRVILEIIHPFNSYDDDKFRERFRLSKAAVLHDLTQVMSFYRQHNEHIQHVVRSPYDYKH
jgi:hypothetical protein